MSVATSTAIGIGIAAGTATAGVIGAKLSSNAASKSAELQTAASSHAADLQKASNDAALKFQQDQAALDAVRANATAQANYNQFHAHEQRMSDFGQALGLAPRNIPAYEPLPTTATAPTSGQTPAGTTPQGMPTGIDPRISALYQKYGVTPGARGSGPADWQYWQNEALSNAKGDWGYVLGELEKDIQGKRGGPGAGVYSGQGGSSAAPSSPTGYASTMPMVMPTRQMAYTPALQMPTANSFASFLG